MKMKIKFKSIINDLDTMTCFPHVQWTISSLLVHIYSVDTFLYPYALLLEFIPYFLLSLCLGAT